jgi:multidrug efflux pump subunit AcrA (membrane-fusion protein)
MKTGKRHVFGLLWALAAVAAGALYYNWRIEVDLIGIVEARVHPLTAQEDGMVSEVLVQVGSPVKAGQVLARLATGDLLALRAQLEAETAGIQAQLEADRQRYRVEAFRVQLQTAKRTADVARRKADLQARRAEIAALDKQIAQERAAERDGLGRSRDLTAMEVRKRTLLDFVVGYTEGAAEDAPTQVATADPELMARSSLSARPLQRLEEIRLELLALEESERRRMVKAPVDGFVVSVLAPVGEPVEAFQPLLEIQESVARYVDVYLPESVDTPAVVGNRVEVIPKRAEGEPCMGVITFVYPGYLPIPQRLMFRGQMGWALKMRVALTGSSDLRPGESVRVRVRSHERAPVVASEAQAAEALAPEASAVREAPPSAPTPPAPPADLSVPLALARLSRVEPSGLAWLEDLGRFLVVSDDTGLHGEEGGAHSPWVFLMTPGGELEPEPLVIGGLERVDNLESVAVRPDGTLLLVASQSLSHAGKRPEARQLLLHVRRDGRKLSLLHKVVLWRQVAALPDQEQRSLGLDPGVPEPERVLDVEAAAWQGDGLLLGLKQPTGKGGAILWRLARVDQLLADSRLQPGQLSLAARVDLAGSDGRPAGFSDLALAPDGRLFALSTVPGVPDDQQLGTLWALDPAAGGGYTARPLEAFPGLKPEGLAFRGQSMALVFDRGPDEPGRFALRSAP